MLITVFTPAYNRAHLLPRLYESLMAQTFQDFEWIIVDDGSTDNTEEIVKEWLQPEGGVNILHPLDGIKGCIRYIKQPNGGKHRAINRGVQEAKGELFFIVDSDDRLPSNSLLRIAYYYEQIKNNLQFAGVCGLKCYFDGRQTGGNQPFDMTDCSMMDIRLKHHIVGDMAEVFRTQVLREFPFPEYDGECFCPEDLVWNRISQKYIMRFFYENIYECEYQPDGLTARIVRIRMDNPQASVTHYHELNTYDISFMQKLKSAVNYWRFRFCMPKNRTYPTLSWFWNIVFPLGWLMHIKDKKYYD